MKYGSKKMKAGGRLYEYLRKGGKVQFTTKDGEEVSFAGGGMMPEMEMGGSVKRGYKFAEEGMEVGDPEKETRAPRAGKDYMNDRQAVDLNVEIDYSDPFRNLDDRDTEFMKEALGYGDKPATVKLGGKTDLTGGYFHPDSVEKIRKSVTRMKLGLQGKTSAGQDIGGMPTIALTRPFGMEDEPEMEDPGQTIPVKDGRQRGVFPGRGREPEERAIQQLRSIRRDEE